MFRMRTLVLAIVLVALLPACDDTDPLAAELAGGGDPLAALLEDASSYDDSTAHGPRAGLFHRLAAAIPGFGGLYRAARCGVVVVLTDLDEEQHAIRVVRAAVEPLVARACPNGIRVGAVLGQFTFLELQRLLNAAQPLLGIRGVYAITVSYAHNTLVITVASRTVAQDVLAALPRLGIPADAVTFRAHNFRRR